VQQGLHGLQAGGARLAPAGVGAVGAGVARLVRLLTAVLLMGTALLVVALVGQGVAGARELPTAGLSGRRGLPPQPPLVPATPAGATFQHEWTTARHLLDSRVPFALLAMQAARAAGERDPEAPPGRPGNERSQLPPPPWGQAEPRRSPTVKDQPADTRREGDGFPRGTVLAAGPAAGPVAGSREDLRARFNQRVDQLEGELRWLGDLRGELARIPSPPKGTAERQTLDAARGRVDRRLEALHRAIARLPTPPSPHFSIPKPPADLATEFQDRAAELQKRAEDLQRRYDEQKPGDVQQAVQLEDEREELRQAIIDLQIENYFHTQGSEGQAPQAPRPPGPPPVRPDAPDSLPLRLPQPGDRKQAQDGTLGTAQTPVPFAEDAITDREGGSGPLERAAAAAERAATEAAVAAGSEERQGGSNEGEAPHDQQQDGRGLPEPPRTVLQAKDATPDPDPSSGPTAAAQPPAPAEAPDAPVVQQAPVPQPAPAVEIAAVEIAAVDESGDPPDVDTSDAALVADTWSEGVFSNGWS
jgi:hypothetical protein